jgi:hypothetical protein
MRNKRKAQSEAGPRGRSSKAANGYGVALARTEPGCNPVSPGTERSVGPRIWEYTLGQEISAARAACLQGLSQIPSGLGKLAYLAVLQQQILEDHEELFEEWLCCSLQQQYEWLYRSLANENPRGTPTDTWLNPSVYSELIPATAEKTARTAYLANLGAILEMLRKELAAPRGRRQEESLSKS